MEVIKKYTLPITEFVYYLVKLKNGKEVIYGKKVYDEVKKKGKK